MENNSFTCPIISTIFSHHLASFISLYKLLSWRY